jgi:hypothetical protein
VVGVAMLALVVYYVATRGVFQGKASGDGWFGFQYLRGIVWFHTLDMRAPLPEYLPFFGLAGPGHHMPNRCPFGPVFVWMPLYLVACAVHGVAGLLHASWRIGNGQSPFEAWVTGLSTLAAVLVGWRYTYVVVARHLGRGAARIGSLAAVWATPIAWYAVTQPFYQHGLAFCFVAILVEYWDRTAGDPGWRRMLVCGGVGGVAMMMRGQEALWLLLPGVEALWHVMVGPARRRWLGGGIVLVAATLVAFAPQMLVWWYYTGSPLHPAQVEPLRPTTPFVVVSLFSTRGGLFPWSPVVYASVAGLVFAFAREADARARRLTLALAAVFALEIYVVSSAWVVTGGYGYGARRLSDGAVLFALGVGLLWARCARARSPWPRRLVAGFVALCIVLNVVTMELLRAKKIPSSGAYARSAERFLDDLGLARAGRLFGAIGYPFVQPAGWLFALAHHAPVTAFEDIVGNWFLDRDGQWLQVQSRGTALDASARGYVMSGLALAPPKTKPAARVTGPIRLLLPMFAHEPIVVHLAGRVPPGARAAAWNGSAVAVADEAKGLRLSVSGAAVHAGVNELTLTLPAGATLDRIDFDSTTDWWRH